MNKLRLLLFDWFALWKEKRKLRKTYRKLRKKTRGTRYIIVDTDELE